MTLSFKDKGIRKFEFVAKLGSFKISTQMCLFRKKTVKKSYFHIFHSSSCLPPLEENGPLL